MSGLLLLYLCLYLLFWKRGLLEVIVGVFFVGVERYLENIHYFAFGV